MTDKPLSHWLQCSEAEVRAEIKQRFEAAGWEAWQFSTPGRVHRQWAGWVDQLFIKDDFALFHEGKRHGGKLRPSQRQFAARIEPHALYHIRHVVFYIPDECKGWLVPGEGEWKR